MVNRAQRHVLDVAGYFFPEEQPTVRVEAPCMGKGWEAKGVVVFLSPTTYLFVSKLNGGLRVFINPICWDGSEERKDLGGYKYQNIVFYVLRCDTEAMVFPGPRYVPDD